MINDKKSLNELLRITRRWLIENTTFENTISEIHQSKVLILIAIILTVSNELRRTNNYVLIIVPLVLTICNIDSH